MSDQPDFVIVDGVPVPASQAPVFSDDVATQPDEPQKDEPQKDETPAEPVEEATDVTTPDPVEYRSDEQVAADAEPVTEDNNDGQPDPGNSPPEKWTSEVSPDEQDEVRSLLGVDNTEE